MKFKNGDQGLENGTIDMKEGSEKRGKSSLASRGWSPKQAKNPFFPSNPTVFDAPFRGDDHNKIPSEMHGGERGDATY